MCITKLTYLMNLEFQQLATQKWHEYFPSAEMPFAVFYADELHGAMYAPKPAPNPRGYTCLFAQLARLHQGQALAFDVENLGCWGAIGNLFGGEYNEEATVKLLVEIERFKIDREQTNLLHQINPRPQPTGRYIIFKPLDQLSAEDDPAIYCVFARADVVSALHTLASYDNTRIDNVIVPFGSGCEQMLTFAFDEARRENPRAVLGGMDNAMRGCVKPDVQTLSFSALMFERMVRNMDRSFLATYIWQGIKNR